MYILRSRFELKHQIYVVPAQASHSVQSIVGATAKEHLNIEALLLRMHISSYGGSLRRTTTEKIYGIKN